MSFEMLGVHTNEELFYTWEKRVGQMDDVMEGMEAGAGGVRGGFKCPYGRHRFTIRREQKLILF